MSEYPAINKKAALLQGIWFEGALLARILMQTIWITLWYQELMSQRVSWLASGLMVFLALAVSTLLVRWFSLRASWRRGLRPAIFAIWMILFFLASLKWLVWPNLNVGLFQTIMQLAKSFVAAPFDFGILWHTLLMPILLWQGVSLGNSRGSLTDTIQSFKIGILLMLLYGLIFMPQINLSNSLPWLAYLFLGLLAISINRIADLIPLRGGRLPSSTGTWWAAITAGAVLLAAVSLAVGGLLPDAIRVGVYIAIGAILVPSALVVIGIALLVVLVINWLHPQFNLSIGGLLDNFGRSLTGILENDRLMKNWQKIGRHTIDEYLLPAIIILVIVVIVLLIFLDLRSRRSWIRRVLPEDNVSDLFERYRQRFRRGGENAGQKRGWRVNRFLAAARIRQIYASLLELAEKVGAPRPLAQTPLEFLPVLEATFPNHEGDTKLITNSYLKVRYGEFPETIEEVEGVEQAWRLIRSEGRALIQTKKREDREKARF